MITYLDTSAFLKLVLTDETGNDAVAALWQQSRVVTCARIGYVEARAAVAMARRLGRITASDQRNARVLLDELWQQIDAIPVDDRVIDRAADLADSERLRGYDAMHLAAALIVRATVMASADDALLAAAQRRGLDTTNPLD
ncbi:MAG: type II toxin-antitoxin system VapC family toxin [Acidimicrobiia bacterium]